MEANAGRALVQEDKAEFPSQPLHWAGGLHFAEPGGHRKHDPGEELKRRLLSEGATDGNSKGRQAGT